MQMRENDLLNHFTTACGTMCCSCSTCVCCTVFLASLLLATIWTAGYWIVKNNQTDKIMSRDFKKKFFSMFNFLGNFVRIYIKKAIDEERLERDRLKVQPNYGQYGNRPPVRVRPVRPTQQLYGNG
ncbi:unnamed protein product, partial [Medioppia subpectinata]